MSTPHKHADIIKAWADGAQIQTKHPDNDKWIDCTATPEWKVYLDYRIKPAPMRRIIRRHMFLSKEYGLAAAAGGKTNVEFTFDMETGKLLDVVLIK